MGLGLPMAQPGIARVAAWQSQKGPVTPASCESSSPAKHTPAQGHDAPPHRSQGNERPAGRQASTVQEPGQVCTTPLMVASSVRSHNFSRRVVQCAMHSWSRPGGGEKRGHDGPKNRARREWLLPFAPPGTDRGLTAAAAAAAGGASATAAAGRGGRLWLTPSLRNKSRTKDPAPSSASR